MNHRVAYLCLGLLVFWHSILSAQPGSVVVGDALSTFAISDQHDKPETINEDVRLIMFSRDMTANKLAKKAFMKRPSNYLAERHAVYMIDVSGMPKFVTKNFAIPKMRKYPYRIHLDRDASLTTALPSQEDKVTLIHLDKLKVTGIEYVDSPLALTQAVEAAAGQ
jgi:hypothetical protein